MLSAFGGGSTSYFGYDAAGSADVLINDAHESYTARKAAAEKNGIDLPPEDPLYLQMMRDLIRSAVSKMIDFKTVGDGMPDSKAGESYSTLP